MKEHAVVSSAEWTKARKALLQKEKELTRAHAALAQARRELPWERVDKPYVFDGPKGEESLDSLFEGRSQLIVYHFMFGADWEVPCRSCSFWADNFNGIIPHLNERDVTFVAISRAPFARLRAFQERLGWSFKWVSSGRTDFNFDYQASFTEEARAQGTLTYNYAPSQTKQTDLVGVSVFYRDEAGAIFHTYSCYSRGVEMVNTTYHYLDLVPKGRDEEGLPYPMAWVRFRDQYETAR